MKPQEQPRVVERVLKGIAASPGVSFGHAATAWDPELVTLNYTLEESEVETQVESVRISVEKSQAQLVKMQD